jgi:hypothetical protein
MKPFLRLACLAVLSVAAAQNDAQAFHWNGHFFSAYLDHGGLHFRSTSQLVATALMLGPGRYTLATPPMHGHGYGYGVGCYGYGCYPCFPTTYYNGTFLGPYCNGQCAVAAPPGSHYALTGFGGYGCIDGYGGAPFAPFAPFAPWGYFPAAYPGR